VTDSGVDMTRTQLPRVNNRVQ